MTPGLSFLADFKLAIIVVAAYLSILGAMYVFQRTLVFLPSRDDPFIHMNKPFRPFSYRTPDGMKLRGLWHPPREGRPTIVYFHGNAGHLGNRLFKAKLFVARGYGIALVGYHGYDGNPGFPSEQNLYADARAAIQAIQKKNIPDKDIVLYGESLGTGVATQMAVEMPGIRALVLEAPYTSVPDVAQKRYWFFPVHYLIKDRFENSKKIGQLKMPIILVHGTSDLTVPYRYGRKLFTYVTTEQKQFTTLDGAGHSNLYDFGAEEAIHAFLENLPQ